MTARIVSIAVFMMPILILAIKGGYFIAKLIFLGLAIGNKIHSRYTACQTFSQASHDYRLPIGFWVFVAIGIGLCVYHKVGLRSLGSYLPFLLAPIVYFGIVRSAAPSWTLWFGAATGGFAAFGFASYQLHIQGIERSHGFMTNPIFFGNSALIAAAVSLIGINALPAANRKPLTVAYLLLGAVAGIGASFFSGSKGGWISLPLLMLMIYYLTATTWSKKVARIGTAVVFASLLAVVLSPKSPVLPRIQDFSRDIVLWAHNESAGRENTGTASSRLEMWRFTFIVAGEHPLLGFGPQAIKERKTAAVINGESDAIVDKYAHVHNEIMDIYLENGLVGLAGFIFLFGTLFTIFYKHCRSQDMQARVLALAGIMFLLLFLEFGLTNPLFPFNAPRNIFCGWAAVLAGLLHARIAAENRKVKSYEKNGSQEKKQRRTTSV